MYIYKHLKIIYLASLGMWDLVPPPRIKPGPMHWELSGAGPVHFSRAGPPGRSKTYYIYIIYIIIIYNS